MGLKEELDRLYYYYNDRKFVHPDPLEFLYNYNSVNEREIVGLIASSLAYGRVTQILRSVSAILIKMVPSPLKFLEKSSQDVIYKTFSNFKHRFTTDIELSCLLVNIKNLMLKYGSLNDCFIAGLKKEDKNIIPAVLNFAKILNSSQNNRCNSLIPSPAGGSAFKRLNLYLRWMVRNDNVDPGGWQGISGSKLIIPLDIHMYRISKKLGFSKRKQADIKTALEVTDALKGFDKDDPVKYDFSLTRLGMNKVSQISFKNVLINI